MLIKWRWTASSCPEGRVLSADADNRAVPPGQNQTAEAGSAGLTPR
jgi:hypothetical protein